MRTLTKVSLPLVAAAALMGVLTGCGSSTAQVAETSMASASSPATPAAPAASAASSSMPATGTPSPAAAVEMTIADFAYSPTTVTVGQQVNVTNSDTVDHTVTIADAGIDVTVPAGGSATFTAPTKPGSYTLTCVFHGSMTGTLTVA